MFDLKTSQDYVSKICAQIARIYEECVIDEFIEWAKQDDEYLRNNDGFINRSGNLRSSLGAAVFKDTQIVFSTPFQIMMNGAQGAVEGRQAVERFAAQTRNRIAKVMVAGMDYAQKVEDIDTKDVLESRRIQCERDAAAVMERAARKAEQRIRSL